MEQKKADRLYDLKACEMDQRAMELSAADEETRRALNEAMRDYNLALVRDYYLALVRDYNLALIRDYYLEVGGEEKMEERRRIDVNELPSNPSLLHPLPSLPLPPLPSPFSQLRAGWQFDLFILKRSNCHLLFN